MANNKKVLVGVGIGCGVLLVVVGLCAGFIYFMIGATSGPTGAANGFLADLREGNQTQALQRMSPAYQQAHPLATFQASLGAVPSLMQQTDSSMTNVNITNGRASVAGVMTTAGGPIPIIFSMSQVGEYWYIDTVLVQGVPLR